MLFIRIFWDFGLGWLVFFVFYGYKIRVFDEFGVLGLGFIVGCLVVFGMIVCFFKFVLCFLFLGGMFC